MATHNRWDLTQKCLESLWPTLPLNDFEILIVDNNSNDETREELVRLGDRIRFIPRYVNMGYGAANNLAASHATGDFLFFINNDLVFQPNWWQAMLEVFIFHPDAGAVGNVQWTPRTNLYDHMGVVFDGVQPVHFGEQFSFRPFRGTTRWGAITAACCAVKRDVFFAVQGFDTSFSTGYEDIDFCLRLGERGYQHYVANDSVVIHLVSGTSNRHVHTRENARIFFERWRHKIERSWSLWDEKILGWNYLMRIVTKPWSSDLLMLYTALRRLFFANEHARPLSSLKA